MTQNVATMHGWLASCGITRTVARREPFTASPHLDGETENVRFNSTDAYQRYMPSSAWSYNVGSGATHSRGWMLPSLVGTLEEEALASPLDNAAAIGHAVLDTADALARVGAGHAGLDPDWFLRKTHLWRQGIGHLGGIGPDLVVGHQEYAARKPGWERNSGTPGQSFHRS